MPSDPSEKDSQLRTAAFEALRRLTEPTGGTITRKQMTAGFEFGGERIPFADRGHGIWRPQRLGRDGAALSVLTSAVRRGRAPPYDDGLRSDEAWLAYRYQRDGPDARDNVALRRAFERRCPIIYFSGIVPSLYSAVFPMYVIGDDPATETFRLASVGTTVDDPVELMVRSADVVKSYMLQLVKRRLHQARFRELVVSAYGKRCTVCRLHHPELLDAAHILEDRDVRGLPEVPNGLALCRIHHGAYDTNIMGIDRKCRIHIRAEVMEEVDGPMLLHGLKEMHNERIHVPGSAKLRPNPEYLAERFERFLAA